MYLQQGCALFSSKEKYQTQKYQADGQGPNADFPTS